MALRGLAFVFALVAATGFAHERERLTNRFVPQAADDSQLGRDPESPREGRGADGPSAITPADADRVIEELRQKTKEVTEARNRFLKTLDQAIGRFDAGSRTPDGKKISAADADLTSGPADIMWAGVRKLFAARMLAARGAGYQLPALAEMDRLEKLIGEARDLADTSQPIVRGLLLVSARDLNTRSEGEWKSKHAQLLKARQALDEAAKQAYASLPIDLPEGETAEERKEKAWDLIVIGKKVPKATPPPPASAEESIGREPDAPTLRRTRLTLPVTIEQGKRITVLNEAGYRMALTDSGAVDENGRHLYYQEEWIQRGSAVVRMRWRVAVDTATGEHIMLKRYEPRERRGSLETLYKIQTRDYLWSLEPPVEGREPSRPELESALAELTRARETIGNAIADYRSTIRQALEDNDASDPDTTPDYGLPLTLRSKLFAIRGHLAQVLAVMEAETKVENAMEDAAATIAKLEPLAAWGNRNSAGAISAPEWEKFQIRADDEITVTHNASADARASLPPEFSTAEGRFPPLQKDVIVHMVRRAAWGNSGPAIRCLQEVWRLATSMRGSRRVQRTVTVIEVDRDTGRQKNVGSSTQYYAAGPNDSLEAIYDEFAAQDLPVSGLPR